MIKAAGIVSAALLAAATNAAALGMKSEGRVEWVCGGVGAEERQELKDLEARANAALLFVTERRGGYLADVDFVVRDQSGGIVLQGRSDGPMCMLSMPPGRYRVEASLDAAKRVTTLRAAKSPGHPARAVLSFPRDPSETIAPSPEEKAQARGS